MRLSGVVITHNEAANIERCLQSLQFCDEIIVLDSGSQDETLSLARRFTQEIHEAPWQGYAVQKNRAMTLAKGEWILSLDADEEVPADLANEIRCTLQADTPYRAFRMARKTMHSGQWIRYGGWYPNRLVRLFRKDSAEWKGDDVHEAVEVRGLVGDLSVPLIHYSFRNISDQVERNNRYSSLGAQALQRRGERFSYRRLWTKPFTKFVETYLLKFGFRDGFLGFVISVSAAYSVFLKWAKLRELERGQAS